MRLREPLKLRTGTQVVTSGAASSRSPNRNINRSPGQDNRGKGEEPFKFPESSRRSETDNFAVYFNYIPSDKQYVWFSYRSANREKASKYQKDKGGIALLWGIFNPSCENVSDIFVNHNIKCSKIINKSEGKLN
jgi:hypothetical protein